jgi:thiamine biosynthesis lipoprotein
MMRRARPLLGTLVEVAAEGSDADRLHSAIEAAFAVIEQVHRLMSFHDPESNVSRLNRAQPGQEVSVDAHTSRVLCLARELSELSKGAFDVTTAPVLVESGFLPAEPAREPGPVGACYRDLDLLPGDRARCRRKGWVDLGGIAKGYAVDCGIAALRACGAVSGIVNAGGDLRCFGAPQPIHVRHPRAPSTMMLLGWLADAALASSAGYFSGMEVDGSRIDPLVDPKRQRCTTWNGSISVAAPAGVIADALTKVVRLAPDRAPEILDHFGAQAVVIDDQGARSCGRPLLQIDLRQ